MFKFQDIDGVTVKPVKLQKTKDGKVEVNKIYAADCVDFMKEMNPNYIDLTVTSPPYDDLRNYKGYSFNFAAIATELFRVTKQGGVVVWVSCIKCRTDIDKRAPKSQQAKQMEKNGLRLARLLNVLSVKSAQS